MSIYIHSYIYIIYNTLPAINNFMIVYYRGQKYSRRQNLVIGSAADMCHHVGTFLLMLIIILSKRDSMSRWLSACYKKYQYVSADEMLIISMLFKRLRTAVADMFFRSVYRLGNNKGDNVYYLTYIFNTSTLFKTYPLYNILLYSTPPCRDG